MLLCFFSVALAVLCAYSIFKKSFLPFFFSVLLFLPDYYGFEISPKFPIVSVKRLIILIFYLYVFINYHNNIKSFFKRFKFSAVNLFLCLYFLLRIVSNLYYVATYGQAIKTIMLLIFEQALLLLAINIIPITSDDCLHLLKSIIYTSAFIFVLGLVESFSGVRITDFLYTVDRFLLNDHFFRLGMLRSTVTFGLPNFYGNFCALVMPLIIYLYDVTKGKQFLIIAFLDVLACIHSGSRSSLFVLFVLSLLFFILYKKDNCRLLEYFKHFLIINFVIIFFAIVLSLISSRFALYYAGTGASLLKAVGIDINLGSLSESINDNYGENIRGAHSRLIQLSGIEYVTKINPLFGLGSGAQNRGDIKYFTYNKWQRFYTYDVGYVGIYADEGLLGVLAFLSLFAGLSLLLLHKNGLHKMKNANPYLSIGLICYLLCLLSTTNLYPFLLLYSVLILQNNTTISDCSIQ